MKGISFVFLFLASMMFYGASAQVDTAAVIDPRIQEVYRDNMKLLASDPWRVKALERLLTERIEIIEVAPSADEKDVKLSTMPLFNKYNRNLRRDEAFDINNFNVLKYDLNFFANFRISYRIDNTNYIIKINPTSK
ncbi:hypothetical protein [Flavobacterium sp. NKUCC04_CG]|uniref:hypothetical protein n=1 Tax=Flavobacterium sp. NKUCC04_CG TaxID=2842121 RepID=UPI001C5A749F|nr:hypothetical protein [Flavobacterium sp. NKUCC04_CG]MBW3518212.1 hypothetical protein [Flavobacterium sp. NKUCC04_CG]